MCLFTACTPTPVYETFPVIPPDSRSCVADAEQLKIDCQASKLPLIEQCKTNQRMIYQQELAMSQSKYQQEMAIYQSNRETLNAQLQTCLNNCTRQSRTIEVGSYDEDKGLYLKEKVVQNDSTYCTHGEYSYGYGGICGDLRKQIDNMAQPPQLEKPAMQECGYIEKSCDDEYELNFKRCGGYYERRCVSHCEKAK